MRQSNPSPSFTCFSRLPSEIRLMIWEASLPTRSLMLYNSRAMGRHYNMQGKSEDWQDSEPAHLWTCYEARNVALKLRPWEYREIELLYLEYSPSRSPSVTDLWPLRSYLERAHTVAVGSSHLRNRVGTMIADLDDLFPDKRNILMLATGHRLRTPGFMNPNLRPLRFGKMLLIMAFPELWPRRARI